MKSLIASGGRGTRLRPITHTQNKHLIPIANKPILHYAIEAAVGAGIRDIAIVHNADSDEVPKAIGDGTRWGARITYLPQLTPGGLSQVVALSETSLNCLARVVFPEPFCPIRATNSPSRISRLIPRRASSP